MDAPSRNDDKQERLVAVDALRGFALLGILVMNIQAFAMPSAAYFNPLVFGSLEGANGFVWLLGRTFFDVKFLSIFSMLFGASLVLAGDGPEGRRRLLWLVVFGLWHGYFLYVGDILFTYGCVGLLVSRARGWTPLRQVRVGGWLIGVSSVLPAIIAAFYEHLPVRMHGEIARAVTDAGVGRELAIFRAGFAAQLPLRAELAFSNQIWGTIFESGWRAAGCMLLGMAAVRTGFFQGKTSLRRHGLAAFVGGLLLTAIGIVVGIRGAFAARPWLLAQAVHLVGSVGITFGLVVGVVTLVRDRIGSRIVGAVARLGRVAFSAYIAQSVAGLVVFGGQGLAQYGHWSRVQLFVAPFAFWALQLAVAQVWTRRFRVGPLEALWRGLYKGYFSLGRIAA